MELRREPLAQLAGKIKSREIGARELVAHSLERLESLNPEINAFVAVDGDDAMSQALDVDEAIAAGDTVGPLAGIPIGVKDLEDAEGFVTTYGSAVVGTRRPAVADSELVWRLRQAGCIVLGKTNTPELGWKPDTDNRIFGATKNPWDRSRSPGGSSGGSAAAIAAGIVPLATGSDGGGSIRIPSSVCGLSGFKASMGRVPSGGIDPPDWPHLSTRGPMARTIADTVYALRSVVGPDPRDLTSLPIPDVSWLEALQDPHVPAKIAWSPTLGYATVDKEVLAACERAIGVLSGLGCEVVEVPKVFDEDPVGDWLTMAAAYNLRTVEDSIGPEQWDDLDTTLKATLEWVRTRTLVDLVRAQDAGHALNLRLVELFHDVRLLVTPTCAAVAPMSGAVGMINGESAVNWVGFTYPFNMTKSPAATVTVGFAGDGLPVGLQLVGPQHGDQVVLRAAAAVEAALAIEDLAPI